MVETLEVGKTYRMTAALNVKRWCVCETTLEVGDDVEILKQTSPNRVEVLVGGGIHKARRSTLRMCVEEISSRGAVDGAAAS